MYWRAVVCAVDFSDPSRRALRLAAALAGWSGAALTVATVDDPLLVEAATQGRTRHEVLAETERELGAFVRESLTGSVQPARLVVRVGHPGDEIGAVAAEFAADLVVVGTHGLRGYQKAVFGSTTERLLRSARRPVLAVPPAGEEIARLNPPSVDVRSILAPVDFDPAIRGDLTVAVDLAAAFQVPLVLVHVVESGRVSLAWREQADAALAERTAEAQRRLDELGRSLGARVAVATVVKSGRPSDGIADAARDGRAGLIVMGLRRKGGFLDSPPGSVAYRVLAETQVPVLALPQDAAAAR